MDNNRISLPIPRWIGGKENFQKLYEEFKESLSKEDVLNFLKEKIFNPNNIKYEDCGDYLEIIDKEKNKAYIFLYYDLDDIDSWDDIYENFVLEDLLEYAAEKIDEAFEKNKTLELKGCEAFVISKNAVINVYYDMHDYEWTVLYFFNKIGECKPDDYSFAKFLTKLTRKGIIKT